MRENGRYKNNKKRQIENFITTKDEIILYGDEVTISVKHDIVICLEQEQLKEFNSLKNFIAEISRNIPDFDNQVQKHFYSYDPEPDFPHNLAVIYIDDNSAILDYWSEKVNNQFTMIFSI